MLFINKKFLLTFLLSFNITTSLIQPMFSSEESNQFTSEESNQFTKESLYTNIVLYIVLPTVCGIIAGLISGKPKPKTPTKKELEIVAYHEAGHTLLSLLMPEFPLTLNKVTIVYNGIYLGTTYHNAKQEKQIYSKKEYLADISTSLGGRAAEELIFNELTTTASSDLNNASNIARSMICNYGMTDILGLQTITMPFETYSQETHKKIDEGITKILNDQYKIAIDILSKNIELLDKLAKELLEKKTLYANEVYELLGLTLGDDCKVHFKVE